jgi:hypothetical protein
MKTYGGTLLKSIAKKMIIAFGFTIALPVSAAFEDCEDVLGSDKAVLEAFSIGSSLNIETARGFLSLMSGVTPGPSGFHLEERGSETTRSISRFWLKNEIEAMGYKVKVEDFDRGANLVVEVEGTTKNDEIVEGTAHYDSVGNPGADDNGSGVAFMLNFLKILKETKSERRLRIVFMDLEERGFQGSEHHARRLRAEEAKGKEETVATFVVDTIGWAHPDTKEFLGVVEIGMGSGPKFEARARFAKEIYYYLQRIGMREPLTLSPETTRAMPGTADHGSYWDNGIPAVLFAAVYEHGFVNPHYHMQSDEMEHYNWEFYRLMSEAVAGSMAFTAGMTWKDENKISEPEWERLRSLERTQVSRKDKELIPEASKREKYLPESLREEHRRRKSWLDSDYDSESSSKDWGSESDSYGGSQDLNTDRPMSTPSWAEPDPWEDLTKEFPQYKKKTWILRYIQTIRSMKSSKIALYLLPNSKGGERAGFVTAGDEVMNLDSDPLEAFRDIFYELSLRGGKVFEVKGSPEAFDKIGRRRALFDVTKDFTYSGCKPDDKFEIDGLTLTYKLNLPFDF